MDGCVIKIMTNTSLSFNQILCKCKQKIWGFFPCNVYESTLEIMFVFLEQLLFFPHSNEYFYSTNYVLSAGNFTSIISCL